MSVPAIPHWRQGKLSKIRGHRMFSERGSSLKTTLSGSILPPCCLWSEVTVVTKIFFWIATVSFFAMSKLTATYELFREPYLETLLQWSGHKNIRRIPSMVRKSSESSLWRFILANCFFTSNARVNNREYWMIYRGSGRLTSGRMIWWFGSLALPPPLVSSAGETREDGEREMTCCREVENGVGEEPNDTTTTTRKTGPLLIIQHSLVNNEHRNKSINIYILR